MSEKDDMYLWGNPSQEGVRVDDSLPRHRLVATWSNHPTSGDLARIADEIAVRRRAGLHDWQPIKVYVLDQDGRGTLHKCSLHVHEDEGEVVLHVTRIVPGDMLHPLGSAKFNVEQ